MSMAEEARKPGKTFHSLMSATRRDDPRALANMNDGILSDHGSIGLVRDKTG